MAKAEEFDSVTENIEGATLINCFAQTLEDNVNGLLRTMVFAKKRPRLGLSRLQPRDNVAGKQRQLAIITSRVARSAEPVVAREVFANLVFEVDFFV